MALVGFGKWFLKKKQEYEERLGRRVSTTEFARYLGVSQATASFWFTEDRKPSGEAALGVCKRLGDYSLLDILGYEKPLDLGSRLSVLPAEFRDRLEAAMHDLYLVLGDRDLLDSPDSPEAVALSIEVMAKYGFSAVNSKSKT